jgi:hypothetical protein
VSELLDKLTRFREILAEGPIEDRKAVVLTFLQGIRIDKAHGRAVVR